VLNHRGGDLERRAVGVLKLLAETSRWARFRQGVPGHPPPTTIEASGRPIVALRLGDLVRRGRRAAAEVGRQCRRDGDRRAVGNVAGRDDGPPSGSTWSGGLSSGHSMVLGQTPIVVVSNGAHREPIAGALGRGARGEDG
jgi:hypothetical protein